MKDRPDQIQPGLLLSAGAASHPDAERFNPLVAPTDNWNDFGYAIAATVGLRTATTVQWFSARFAIRDFSNLKHFVNDGHKASAPASSLAQMKYPFACLLTEVRAYAAIGRMFGVERGRALLSSINDISVIRRQNGQVPGWPSFFDDPVFQKAMVRSSEAFGRLSTGLAFSRSERMSTAMRAGASQYLLPAVRAEASASFRSSDQISYAVVLPCSLA
jgi:hypothetical protein